MGKPDTIILIRHGQSEGNVDKKVYLHKPDYAVELTEDGRKQVAESALKIAELIKSEAAYYVSPFWRTRQTSLILQKQIPVWGKPYEDLRIREQEWLTAFDGPEINENARDRYGHMYYRFPGGESNADVYDRISDFLNSMFRDFEKPDYPSTALIVTHGMAIRVFMMRFFHLKVEEYELMANPKNAQFFILKLDKKTGKYALSPETPITNYPSYNHTFQFNWDDPLYK